VARECKMAAVITMIGLILALPVAALCCAAGPVSGETRQKVEFAVVPALPGPTDDWLTHGVAFDLEKRLGRLPSLEAADRLRVAEAMRAAAGDSEKAIVGSVTDRTSAGIVLYITAAFAGDRVSVGVDVWRAKKRAASLERSGKREDLFRVVDGLVDGILPEIGEMESVPGLKWAPCGSVAVYEGFIRGMISLQKGDLAGARSRLSKVLDAERDNWFARYFMGAVELYQGNIAKAAQYCREAISLNPDFYPGVYANLSYCCAAMGDDKQAEWAKAEFERRAGKPLPARTVPGAMPALGMGR
jgi:tetratricopeptide (TPR) repeat protein